MRPMRVVHAMKACSAAALLLSACGGGGGSGAGPASQTSLSDTGGVTVPARPNAPGWAQFVYPQSAQLGIDSSQAFQWSSVSGSAGYQLQIGTSLGASDVFDSGVILGTSVSVPHLPASGTLYARVRAIPVGWGTALGTDFSRGTYVTFSIDANVAGAAFLSPQSGATVDADTPITWQHEPLALGYRLKLGTSSGTSDLLDSGIIASTMRVVPGLPSGGVAYATLETYYAGNVTRSQALSFVVGTPSPQRRRC